MKCQKVLFDLYIISFLFLSSPIMKGTHFVSSDSSCKQFNFNKCTVDESWIIETQYNITNEVECQIQCDQMYGGTCSFYIHNDATSTCQLLNHPQIFYLNKCDEFGMPPTPSILDCYQDSDPCKVFRNWY